jgi:hypothetical protein
MMVNVSGLSRRAGDAVVRGNELVWRNVVNLQAVRDYRREPPQLDDVAQRLLSDLRQDGVATCDFVELTGDPALLESLRLEAKQMEENKADQIGALREDQAAGRTPGKPFLVEMLDPLRPVVAPSDPLVQAALAPALKGVADHYFGMITQISSVNVWRNLASGTAPSSSQLWHRDIAEDRVVLKAFIYLEDVTEDGGPFTYAPGTQPGGPRELKLKGEFDGMNYRIVEERDAATLNAMARTFTGPAGTLVVADTLGYHRGGWATKNDRLLATVRYSTRGANRQSRLRAPEGIDVQNHRKVLAYAR